jgi:hypothetical protein
VRDQYFPRVRRLPVRLQGAVVTIELTDCVVVQSGNETLFRSGTVHIYWQKTSEDPQVRKGAAEALENIRRKEPTK